jgi:hypothetical protein
MSAQAAKALALAPVRWARPEPTRDEIEATAPQMVATMGRYLGDLGGLLKPASVKAAEVVLRHFAGRVTQADVGCTSVRDIRRRHVKDYLVWLRARPGAQWGTTVSELTVDHRLGLLMKFFERSVTWGYADVPRTIPIRASDRPSVCRPRRRRDTKEPIRTAKPADPACRSVAAIGRGHVEDYKIWLAARPGTKASTLSATTIRNCLGTLRTFFERIIEWGYDDAPGRVPIYANDLPRADEPLPRFLDDPTAAKFMAALAVEPTAAAGWWSSCWPAPACASTSCATSRTTPWCASVTRSGCASRWASSTTTATFHCIRCWSTSSPTTGLGAELRSRACSWSATTEVPSTPVPFAAM